MSDLLTSTPWAFSISSTRIHWIWGLFRDWLFSSTQAYTHFRHPMQRERSRP
jgi:hypothetical protein